MTTEGGIELVRHARKNIAVLERRRVYLLAKIDEKETIGRDTGFERSEVRALEWALPVLETEWDDIARLRRIARLDQSNSTPEEKNP